MKKSEERREYLLDKLELKDCPENPLELFEKWFELAKDKIVDYNAFVLATSDREGIPSARNVLLRQYGEDGFIFFTNYLSLKGQNIGSNPNVCFLFSWLSLEKQIKLNGKVVKITRAESEKYFNSRPYASRVVAHLSKQSQEIKSRYRFIAEVTKSIKEKEKYYDCPEHWGGYKLLAESYEFWQGRESRLHNRVFYFNKNQENKNFEKKKSQSNNQKYNWQKKILYP